ncbi:protein Wnt-5b-like isoform X2 [Lethenteron reissneri]|uniref:protein Wnt-5b-like isoform X2 n=1 Tax=Lethenteron reissneri TaxID=7753 RepID=UPI002AB7A63A|nr:protein Wnt-5b-like isoform X2 [Lethenteron reissneri]XP_061437338.1 protein Wnt-5b-like isoform X2 [Lethenteron reissneri]
MEQLRPSRPGALPSFPGGCRRARSASPGRSRDRRTLPCEMGNPAYNAPYFWSHPPPNQLDNILLINTLKEQLVMMAMMLMLVMAMITMMTTMAVYNLASIDCKCHFEFGICVLQVCSPHLADFRKVGNFLKEKYDTSSAMRLVSHKTSGRRGGAAGAVTGGATRWSRWSRWRLEPVNEWLTAPTASELVHVSASPDYCERDDASGIPGVVGRRCNVTSEGTEGCSVITCCDRGYDISQVTVEKQCGCKEQLRWNVRCKLCPSTVDQYFCK